MPRTIRRLFNLLTPFGWQIVAELGLAVILVGVMAR